MTSPAPPVFILGAPRSGTTWVQSLLGSHPSVATPPETHLAMRYLQPIWAAWTRERAVLNDLVARTESGVAPDRRVIGLPTIFTQADLEEMLRNFVERWRARTLALKPGSFVALEKSPSNSRAVDVIARAAPDARFIHVLRDPRDVVVSLIRASEGWGRRWAPETVAKAAQVWRRNVVGAQRASRWPERYREVRYEDLRADSVRELCRLLSFCGVASTVQERQEIVFRAESERGDGENKTVVVGGELSGRLAGVPEPAGFYGTGETGGWREVLDRKASWELHAIAGDLLIELGYEVDDSWVRVGRTRSLWYSMSTRYGRSDLPEES